MNMVKPKSLKQWGITIGVIIISGLVVYAAIFNEYVYRLIIIAFLIGFAFSVNKKLNQLLLIKSEELSKVQKGTDIHEPALSNSKIKQKEIELEKVDFDRTQILEELFNKAALDEAEKQKYRSKIKQKDTEISGILQELLHAKNIIQQAFIDTKNYFRKENPIKEIAASVNHDLAINGDITELNKELQSIQSQLSEETIQALEENSFIDKQFNLTRNGYKALVKEIGKDIRD